MCDSNSLRQSLKLQLKCVKWCNEINFFYLILVYHSEQICKRFCNKGVLLIPAEMATELTTTNGFLDLI